MCDMMTCIHREEGFCPACQLEFETDEVAWVEYGQHPAGEARYAELLEEMAADAATEARLLRENEAARCWAPPAGDDEVPF